MVRNEFSLTRLANVAAITIFDNNSFFWNWGNAILGTCMYPWGRLRPFWQQYDIVFFSFIYLARGRLPWNKNRHCNFCFIYIKEKEGKNGFPRPSRFAAKVGWRRATHQNTRWANKARAPLLFIYIWRRNKASYCAAYLRATAVSSRDKRDRANGEKWGGRDIITRYEQTFFVVCC